MFASQRLPNIIIHPYFVDSQISPKKTSSFKKEISVSVRSCFSKLNIFWVKKDIQQEAFFLAKITTL